MKIDYEHLRMDKNSVILALALLVILLVATVINGVSQLMGWINDFPAGNFALMFGALLFVFYVGHIEWHNEQDKKEKKP